jgi:rare lipoprotein A (peptidoglycan hydrolase)
LCFIIIGLSWRILKNERRNMFAYFKLVQTIVYALILNFQASIPMANCSWYGEFFHGKQTASGITYDMYQISFAHRTLPLGTRGIFWNPETGVVRIARNIDRGNFPSRVDCDLSMRLFAELTNGELDRGVMNFYFIPLDINLEGILYPHN